MKFAPFVVIGAMLVAPALSREPAPEQVAAAALEAAPVFDGHNDVPIQLRGRFDNLINDFDFVDTLDTQDGDRAAMHTDLVRLEKGDVGAQFWSVYIPGEAGRDYARTQLEQIATACRMIEKYPDVFAYAGTADEVVRARRQGKIASMLGMEGGYGIENSLGPLKAYYDLGVRYMTLTHNTHTDWAD